MLTLFIFLQDFSSNSLNKDARDAVSPAKIIEDDLLSLEKRIFFCQICRVPCLSESVLQLHYRGSKHKKREKTLKSETFLGMAMKNEIKSLLDYIKEPSREPLVGLEYVVEHKTPGKKTPTYTCELCDYKTELAPIVQHLIGFKHRKAYIGKEFPFLLKTPPGVKEDRIQFLKRMAQDIEKDEGVKTYKTDPGPKPKPLMSVKTPVKPLKQKSRWDHEHDEKNARRDRAQKFLETFEIDTDAEAFSVMSLTENLTQALKGYCFKQKAISKATEINVEYANRLKAQQWQREARWAKQFAQAANQAIAQAAFLALQYNSMTNWNTGAAGKGNWNATQQNQQQQLPLNLAANNSNPQLMMQNENQRLMMQNRGHSEYKNANHKLMMPNQQGLIGVGNQNPMMQNQGGDYNLGAKSWNKIPYTEGSLSRESMMLKQQAQFISDSIIHNQQVKPVQNTLEGIRRPQVGMQEQIMPYASRINIIQDSVLLNRQAQQMQHNLQSGNSIQASMMQQQRAQRALNTLPLPCPIPPSEPFRNLSSWDKAYNRPDFPLASARGISSFPPSGSKIYDNERLFAARDANWMQKPIDTQRRDLPVPRGYPFAAATDYLSDEAFSSRFLDRSKKNDLMLAHFPVQAKNISARPQQIPLEPHMIPDPVNFPSADSFRKFPQDARSNILMEKHSMNLPPEIVNRVRGKDAFTATAILNQLASFHPALQSMNISNLVRVLVDNGVIQ